MSGPPRIVLWLEGPVELFGRLAAWVTLALVLLVAGDVLLRYLFSLGTVALQELEWHLVSPIALLGMSYALKQDAHVRVDLLYERLGKRGRAAIDLVAALLIVFFAGVVIDLSLPYVQQARAIGEGSPDPGGLPHRFLLKAFIPLGFALLLLQGVAQALRQILRLTG